MKQYQLINNKQQNQYQFDINGAQAIIQYKSDGKNIYLLHTEVPEDMEGKGIGGELVKQVLQDIEKNNMTLVVRCAFVAAYIERHSEWEKLTVTK